MSEVSHGLMLPSTGLYLGSLGGTKSTLGAFVTQSRSALQAGGEVSQDWEGACSVNWKGDVRRGMVQG